MAPAIFLNGVVNELEISLASLSLIHLVSKSLRRDVCIGGMGFPNVKPED